MTFQKHKKDFLTKKDKSKKGDIDKGIKKLVNLINSKKNYYTTSSCSGRVVLIKKPDKKQDSEWLLVKHDKVSFNEIKKALKNISKEQLWFRVEPLIMHICCKTLEDAKKLLVIARKIFKRAGIISLNKKIIIEIIGTGFIYTIIADKGKMLVSENYIKVLIKEANKKLMKNKRDIDRFYNKLFSANIT